MTVSPGLATWDADKDVWGLYDVRADYTQANDCAAQQPARLAEMKKLFLAEAKKNKVFPVGGSMGGPHQNPRICQKIPSG